MEAFSHLEGTAYVLRMANVDTDIIIPAQYLKTISRTGLGVGAFSALRHDSHGNLIVNNPIDRHLGEGKTPPGIIIAGENFGCGSSREHASWALLDLGVRAVIAPSYGDIFQSNAFKNGLLTVRLEQAEVDSLMDVAEREGASLAIDLNDQLVRAGNLVFPFEIDAFRRKCLLNGWDEIELTLREADKISAFEARERASRPWVHNLPRTEPTK
ncbi:MAG: 3-isopropylmalate dehydratase small subunit [Pseudomonadota bacterium]